MGVVYRATDRLTGDAVALKRVTTSAEHLSFDSRSDDLNLPLALAQEFRTLASLHHPHVISVLDYGFDEQRYPFFTMSLLENARTIVQAGQGQVLGTQVDLLVQALQALVYLHRRGILHRDLKPGNVLVVEERVNVLDFGLSVIASHTVRDITQTTAGTIAYMAPELFAGAPSTRASDLYSIGVMAFELFTGRFPYNDANIALLFNDILTKPVQVPSIGVNGKLAAVLERLLVKTQHNRYSDAGGVIRDLCAAAGCSLPPETTEIRESFLQAARFTGRATELAQLSEALDAALAGRGSAWLVRGESGVGKSRLADELRTLALVKGALVLRGQAVSEGGSPYQLWREIVRWLALTADPVGDEASVLKPLVPDIGDLLGCDVSDALPLDPQTTQNRLFRVVVDGVRRQSPTQPTMVILEDLQWAGSESLALLDRLTQGVSDWPLLLVGNYRDDERPHLPDDLPEMQVLKLERLTEQNIAELSASMLGPAGRRQPVVDLLQRETEGNPFFLVEVVRALAEEAGQLDGIGLMTLPVRVLAGGVRRLVQRRLSRVPEDARPLLQLAAVAGRELDLDVLQALTPEADLNGWLTSCADVAVLELRVEQWRFAHDQLRQGILDALPDDVRPGLHRQVAETLERSFPERVEEQPGLLVHHWEQTGESERAVTYLRRAGEQAAAQFANAEAVNYLSRALDLAPEGNPIDRYAVLLARERIYDLQGEREAQRQDLVTLWKLAEALDGSSSPEIPVLPVPSQTEESKARGTGEGQEGRSRRAEVALRQAHYAQVTSDYPAAIAAAQVAIGQAQMAQDVRNEAAGYLQSGRVLRHMGDYEAARTQLEQALAQAAGYRQVEADSMLNLGIISHVQGDYAGAKAYCEQALHFYLEIGDPRGRGLAFINLGNVSADQGDYGGAGAYYKQALRTFREIGDRLDESLVLNNLGSVSAEQGNYVEAKTYFEQILRIYREIGDRGGKGRSLGNLGFVSDLLGDYAGARACYEQALRIFREIGTGSEEGNALANLSLLSHHLGDDGAAREYAQQALLIAQELGNRRIQGYALTSLGHALAGLGHLAEAAGTYGQALALRWELGEHSLAMECLAGLARVFLAQGDLFQAQAQVERIRSYMETQTLDGTDEPFRVCLTCYRVLRANGDIRARDILNNAHRLLQERAAKISDEKLRRSFLENVTAHREIVREFVREKEGTDA
jgi:tetratricopeptide (TPR) repeat protein